MSEAIPKKKYLLKAWIIGLGITLFSAALLVTQTPLEGVAVVVSIPGMAGIGVVVYYVQKWIGLNNRATAIAALISLVVFGSVIYGALALVILRLRDRHKGASH